MFHSEYLEHLDRHFGARSEDGMFADMLEKKEKIVGTMRLLDLDRTADILSKLYSPAPRNKPRDPLSMLRSLVLMTLLRFTGVDKWVKETRFVQLYAILCGFEPGDVPGVGTYYDFMKRMIDGPYGERSGDGPKRSDWLSRSHERDFAGEKEAKRHETDPNHSKSELLARKLLENADVPRGRDFNQILEDLLFRAGVIPAIEAGLLTETDGTILSGDGSIQVSAASPYGRPACSCRKEGIRECGHGRLYGSPTAEWCHDHRADSFKFGDRYYHIIVTVNGHDFPMITIMPGGNESDYTLSLAALDRLIKTSRENGAELKFRVFCGDGHHDSRAHYEYLLEKGIVPIIPLSKNSRKIAPHLKGRGDVRLDEDGTPLCPGNARMRRHQYDKKQKKHVFCCSAKRGTHENGKAVYVFREELCPLGGDCDPKSSLGPFAYIKSEEDPRLFPPIPRDSRLFKEIYKQRSASERINAINDSYGLDGTSRNACYGLIRLTLANIAHHVSVRYAEAVKAEAAGKVPNTR